MTHHEQTVTVTRLTLKPTRLTDLEEPVRLVAMVLVDVVEGGHGLGSQVFTAGGDVHRHDGQRADVVLLRDKEQHVTAPTPRRLHVHCARHVIVRRRHHPAQNSHALAQRLRYRVIIRRCSTPTVSQRSRTA